MTNEPGTQKLLDEAQAVRDSARDLTDSVEKFANITRKGLLRATWQGVIQIVLGVFLAVSLLGYSSQTWSCNPGVLLNQEGSIRDRICTIIFPQIKTQKTAIKTAKAQAAEQLAREQELKEKLDKIAQIADLAERYLTPKNAQQ